MKVETCKNCIHFVTYKEPCRSFKTEGRPGTCYNYRLNEKVGQTHCSCGSNDVDYNWRDEIHVCRECGTYW